MTTSRRPVAPRDLRARPTQPITVVRAGLVPYGQAWEWQRDLVERRATGAIGDTLLLLEHPRVFTAGKRTESANIVFDAAERARRGIDLHWVDRGGDVTYHGPGQLVGYPILGLSGPRVVDYVRAIEEVSIRVAEHFGVSARRVPGFTGVWVGDAKLTAIGVRVSARGVTSHGWAMNVTTDLDDFAGIVPCGIPDRDVCSLSSLDVQVTLDDVAEVSARTLGEVFGATLESASPDDLGLSPTPQPASA